MRGEVKLVLGERRRGPGVSEEEGSEKERERG
jgi:hypothetical protein